MKALFPLVLVLIVGVAGCAHDPEPAYDFVAVNAQVLGERTKAAVADGDAGRLTLAESRRFLRQSRAQARSIRARAEECRLSADELKILDWLEGEYTALLRRPRPLRWASALRLQNSLDALQELRPTRSYGYWTDATSLDTVDTDTMDTSTSDYDHHHHGDGDHDHGGHDHGGHDHGDSGGGHGHR